MDKLAVYGLRYGVEPLVRQPCCCLRVVPTEKANNVKGVTLFYGSAENITSLRMWLASPLKNKTGLFLF